MVKVSVVIPVYNTEAHLERCLESVINQTLKDIEIICINDGSEDGSLRILQKYRFKDKRIKVIRQENQGQGAARNVGINIARGKYIGFVDSDDWIEAHMYEALYNMAENKNADVVIGNFKEHDAHLNKMRSFNLAESLEASVKLTAGDNFTWKDIKSQCLSCASLTVWNKIYKKDFIEKNGISFPPYKHAEDHAFTIDAILSAGKICYLEDYLYNYQRREGSSCNSSSVDNIYSVDIVKIVENIIKKRGLYAELSQEFEKYAPRLCYELYKYAPKEYLSEFRLKCQNVLSEKQYREFVNMTRWGNNKFVENLFSLKNDTSNGVKCKSVTVLGFRFQVWRA